jgi:hypothetical protein
MSRAKVQAMTASALQAPGFQRRKVSKVIVTALNDGLMRISAAPQHSWRRHEAVRATV